MKATYKKHVLYNLNHIFEKYILLMMFDVNTIDSPFCEIVPWR